MTKASESEPDSHENSETNDAAVLKELRDPWRKQRPFSLPDLIQLGTLDLELAAWLISNVSRGASYILGAEEGGVGKSTTMRALLSFVPGNRPFAIALPGKIAGIDGAARCIISLELSDHDVPDYLWGQDLRDFFALAERGHMLVGNMHADDLAEAHAQISVANGVPERHFRAVSLFIFVGTETAAASPKRSGNSSDRRVIREIFHSDGTAPHESVFTRAKGLFAHAPRDATWEVDCRRFLEQDLSGRPRTIEDTRRIFLAWEKRHNSELPA